MNTKRFSLMLVLAGLVTFLSGCVVAPIGARPYAAYPQAQVYIEPAPLVVAPSFWYWGYRGEGGGYRDGGERRHHGHRGR
jgi:hypothetical protein